MKCVCVCYHRIGSILLVTWRGCCAVAGKQIGEGDSAGIIGRRGWYV